MPKTLVIVESPAKCKKIEQFLGPGYKVIASFGHLTTLIGLESIDIHNGFKPKYSLIQEPLKLKQVERIRSEISNSDDIILATDDDREGEAIGYHICELFGLSVTNTKRIIFHEITESAIQSAVSHPKRVNMEIVKAQQSRQIMDLLVGYLITPILWNCVSKKHDTSLSAGRCQTPALRLVYENYLEIKKSPGKMVYNTTGYFTNLHLLFELNKQFDNKDTMNDFLQQCKYWEFLCVISSPKKNIKKAPEPLTTSGLQQLASNELHMSPKDTMRYAQQLYEGGHITYMRTDSKKYSCEFVDKTKNYIESNYGIQYISQNIENITISGLKADEVLKKKKTVAEKKGIPSPQEAHEAIRPVDINMKTIPLNDNNNNTDIHIKAKKLYEIIWKRTLESSMASGQYISISAKISAPLKSEFIYKVEKPIFLGWLIVENKKDDDKDNNVYEYISKLKTDIIFKPKKIDAKCTMIELKPHYTEAHLVKLLEDKGIGRPSTFASLVDKIQERKYVEKQNIIGKEVECIDYTFTDDLISENKNMREFGNEKNKLVILPLGIIVIEFLLKYFDDFFNYEYTKEMEDRLDLIAKGEEQLETVCSMCYNGVTTITNELQHLQKFSLTIDSNHSLIIGKHGPVIKYIDPTDKKNVSFIPVKKNLNLDLLRDKQDVSLEDLVDNTVYNDTNNSNKPIGKYKGHDLFIKKGKYGFYAQWGKETKTLKDVITSNGTESDYINIIRYLDKDTVLDPTKPVGLVRELNATLSIRTGKYGDYIFYKKPRVKNPQFFKLKDFNSDYKKCDKAIILNWIKQTYNIE